jgi:prepilin-type processing-associated H-X9-DG protein
MVKETRQITTPLARVEAVKMRLQEQSKVKAIAILAYGDGGNVIWFDGHSVTHRPIILKIVANEIFVHYEDRGDWLHAGTLR